MKIYLPVNSNACAIAPSSENKLGQRSFITRAVVPAM